MSKKLPATNDVMKDIPIAPVVMKTKDETILVKNKKHPRHDFYHGMVCTESTNAFMSFLSKLNLVQYKLFADEQLTYEPDKAYDVLKEMVIGDKVGIALQYDEGYVPCLVQLDSIIVKFGGQYSLSGVDVNNHEHVEFDLREASIALALGYLERLYDRENRPYGIPEYSEMKIRIHYDEKDEKKSSPEETKP